MGEVQARCRGPVFSLLFEKTMNSINQQQPEDNRDDLQGREAAEKLSELVNKAKICFMCTNTSAGTDFATRPMTVQKVDKDGVIWFLSASDSHQNQEITADPRVSLLFQGSTYSDFLRLSGEVTILTDPSIIEDLWNPMLKTWFTEGKDDPRITVLKFVPDNGYYWDTKHNQMVAFAKQMIGAMIGKTLDDSIEGTLKL